MAMACQRIWRKASSTPLFPPKHRLAKVPGLGLAYVAQAVADMGGVIELETEPGRTQFQLRLPAVLDKGEG